MANKVVRPDAAAARGFSTIALVKSPLATTCPPPEILRTESRPIEAEYPKPRVLSSGALAI